MFSHVMFTLLFAVVLADDDEARECTGLRVEPETDFSYDTRSPHGPGRWGTHCEGTRQSPVDVVPHFDGRTTANLTSPAIVPRLSVLRWKPVPTNFMFECESNFGTCGTMNMGGTAFELAQLHFHAPAEHRLSGRRYPLELHFVHQALDGRLAVAAVLFRVGKHNRALQHVLDAAAARYYAVVDVQSLLVAASADVCTWDGSLTTPPCSEGVSWVLSLKILSASLRQIGEYRAMVGDRGTARPLQPSNGRPVRCFPQKKPFTNIPGIL